MLLSLSLDVVRQLTAFEQTQKELRMVVEDARRVRLDSKRKGRRAVWRSSDASFSIDASTRPHGESQQTTLGLG